MKLLFYLTLLLSALVARAQIPAEDATLNFSTVYFEEAFATNARQYELQLYKDSVTPKKKPYLSLLSDYPAFFARGLSWGAGYQWRLIYRDSSGRQTGKSAFHHFQIQPLSLLHNEQFRLRIIRNDSLKHAGGFVAVDYCRSIFDRSGYPVWTIPTKDTLMGKQIQIRDLRFTSDNSITFLTGKAPLEIDPDGRLLWKAPHPFIYKGDTIQYHHDFQKTKRGTYMVMGMRKVYRPLASQLDSAQLRSSDVKRINGRLHLGTLMSQLFEFGRDGKLLWSWDSDDFLSDEDLSFKKVESGVPNFASHANAFGETADGKYVFMGFRDLNRIIKIEKQSKKVVKEYGELYPSRKQLGSGLFRKQHGATINARGNLLLLNNNSFSSAEGVSSVVEISEEAQNGQSHLVWKMDLDFDSLSNGKSISGGNVNELPNGNILVCGGTLNRLFELDGDKKTVWDAFVELKRAGEEGWSAFPQYRCFWLEKIRSFHFLCEYDRVRRQVSVWNSGNHEDEYLIAWMDAAKTKTIKKEVLAMAPGEKLVIAPEKATQAAAIIITSVATGQTKELKLK